MFSQRSHEGCLMIDHRASPGLPEEHARRMGFDPHFTREGKVYETPTFGCAHCRTPVMMNPLRTRDRAYCAKCSHYICDLCDGVRREGGYLHRSFDELADLVRSGKYILSGTAVRPVLTYIGDQSNG